MIFPEGTTNSGEWLMDFKKGAFLHEVPLKIRGLTYNTTINPCWNLVDIVTCLMLMFCNWRSELTMHEFDDFNPQYTIDKNGLKKGDENNWIYIVEDIYYLMEYGFDLKKSGASTWRDKADLKKNLNLTFR